MNDETVSVPEETIHSTTEPTSPPSEVPDLSSDDGSVTETESAASGDDSVIETEAPTPVEDPVPEVTSAASESTEATSSVEIVTDDEPEATEETISITIEDIRTIGSDIAHADLFGSFLICGTLIGLALLRKVYGT